MKSLEDETDVEKTLHLEPIIQKDYNENKKYDYAGTVSFHEWDPHYDVMDYIMW